MTPDELTSALNRRKDKYLADCEKSVHRNKHMNAVEESDVVTRELAEKEIDLFLFCVPKYYNGGSRVLDVLEAMTACAKDYCPPRKDRVIDAIIVDFINFVGVCHCVDYALYTRDVCPGAVRARK